MKTDTYLKAVLTVIAIMLSVIACKSLVSPEKTAVAQGPLAGVSVQGESGGIFAFDSRSGEICRYDLYHNSSPDSFDIYGHCTQKWKMTAFGEPLVILNDPAAPKPRKAKNPPQ